MNMDTQNIYVDKKLKYPLNIDEYNKLDNVWKLINIFSIPYVQITDYRNYLMKTIRKNYTIDQFHELEMIINKLFWNLRWLMFPLFIKPKMNENEYNIFIKNNYDGYDELSDSLILCNKIKYDNEDDLDIKIKKIRVNSDTYYRSFINKLVIIDRESKIIYNKKMEGSSEIFGKNFFNLYTMTILFDRNLYEKIMVNPYRAQKYEIELSKYYYQYDYGFPNLNYCAYSIGNNEYKLNRIKKIYYNKSNEFEHWYKLI